MAGYDVSPSPQAPVLDEPGKTVRFGLIALATDLTSEGDFARLLPGSSALHTTRVAYANPTTPENLAKMAPLLTEAADLLVPGIALSAICYSCTSAAATIGEDTVARSIQASRPGVPVVTPTGAARLAFQALGVNKVAVLTPYMEAASRSVGDYFSSTGLDVCRLHGFGLDDDRAMARISREAIISGALAVDGPDNEAIFLSCTALPAVGAIAEIEARTGKPVVSSNQASAWAMRRLGGFHDAEPKGYGRLFELALPEADAGRAA